MTRAWSLILLLELCVGIGACVGDLPAPANGGAIADSGADAVGDKDAGQGADGISPDIDAAADADAQTSYRDTVLADDPTVYFRLGDAPGTTMAKDERGAASGTYTGGATLGVAGLIGQDTNTAVAFDGTTSYVDLGNTASFEFPTGDFTLEAWIKPDPAGSGTRTIFSKLDDPGGWSLAVASDGKVGFTLTTSGGGGLLASPVAEVTVSSHIVLTFTGTIAHLYSNGTDLGSKDYVGKRPDNGAYPACIGCTYVGSTGPKTFFRGTIDEVAVYRKALSPSAIMAHYMAGTR